MRFPSILTDIFGTLGQPPLYKCETVYLQIYIFAALNHFMMEKVRAKRNENKKFKKKNIFRKKLRCGGFSFLFYRTNRYRATTLMKQNVILHKL